jgi:polar amino acid transport system substrate-binding protein
MRLTRAFVAMGMALALIASGCSKSKTGSQSSNDLLAQIQQRGFINAGYAIYPPYVFLDENAAVTGIFPDYTAEIAKRMGLSASNSIVMTSSAFIPSLGANRVDMLPGYSYTPERAKVASFSSPVMYIPDCFLVRKDSGITSFDQLAGKTVAVARASAEETIAKGLIDQGKFNPKTLKEYSDFVTPIQDLQVKRIDAFLYDSVSFLYSTLQNPSFNTTLTCIPIPPELEPATLGTKGGYAPVFYIVPKKNSARLVAKIDDIIKAMIADGTVAQIFAKYGLTEPYLISGKV